VLAGLSAASFLPADENLLVAAALACPWCLSGEVEWRLGNGEHEDWAECECASCGHPFVVHLSPQQALRLALAPPGPAWVDVA
jgi:hypothetical protein